MGRAVIICGRALFLAIQVIFVDHGENCGIDGRHEVVICGRALFPAIQVILLKLQCQVNKLTISWRYVEHLCGQLSSGRCQVSTG